MGTSGLVGATTLLMAIVLLGVLVAVLYTSSSLLISAPQPQKTTATAASTSIPATSTILSSNTPTFGVTTSTIQPPANTSNASSYSPAQIIQFALSNINSERSQFGLQPVTLSNVTSGQQHSDSMLYYDYFSHWDPFGMKPYMRYTLLGGTQGVEENVAYEAQLNESCLGTLCSIRQINATKAVSDMNYQMLNNDSLCCNNGHRNNTLDPNHNQMSLGVSYNKTNIYLVEDFINNYIEWLNMTPGIIASGEMVYLNGLTLHGSNLSSIQINYDPLPHNMSDASLNATKAYGEGQTIAGVTHRPYYYQNVTTLYGTEYVTRGNYFNIDFNISTLTKSHGAGVYTIIFYLTNSTGGDFMATTYSIFINGAGEPYTPDFV